MKQKIIVLFFMVVLITLSACTTPKKLSTSDFDFLQKGMSYSEVVQKVGEPSQNIGSGLYIFAYSLSDGRSVFISFADLDHLQDARVYDPKTKESTSLLEP